MITQNNQKATVKQGTKIPVQTVVNNTVSVQFVDAVLELDVTPQITADGTIYMDVTVENDQIDQAIPRVQGIPAIDTQSAETKVTVIDGATVVIGGIIVTQQQTAIAQVPLVGSVPVLGNLFKHTTVSSTSQELLFFLTPRILPSKRCGVSGESRCLTWRQNRKIKLSRRSRIDRLRLCFSRPSRGRAAGFASCRTSAIFADFPAARACCWSNLPRAPFSPTAATPSRPGRRSLTLAMQIAKRGLLQAAGRAVCGVRRGQPIGRLFAQRT